MKYSVGLVVGKFCPLHKGHELLINTALAQCDKVVLISYTNPGLGFSAETRKNWLKKLFPTAIIIVPKNGAKGMPVDGGPEIADRNYCAWLCEMAGVTPDVVFSSESYGQPFAEHLARRWSKPVDHVMVDIDRVTHKISGTALRNDPRLMSEFVHPFVRATMTKRIVLLGGESAGKTTLAKALYRKTLNPWVPEFGRWFTETAGGVANLRFEHLLFIGQQQVRREDSLLNSISRPWIICDTSPLTTRFYSEKLFGKVDSELLQLSKRHYDMYVILGSAHGWEQDGDRMSPEFSEEQRRWYFEHLEPNGSPLVYLHDGSVAERVQTVTRLMETV